MLAHCEPELIVTSVLGAVHGRTNHIVLNRPAYDTGLIPLFRYSIKENCVSRRTQHRNELVLNLVDLASPA
jgi:hypothetical protein